MFEFIKKITDNFKSADMHISGGMNIGTLQKKFRENFGLYLRVYKGTIFANPESSIAQLNRSTSAKINTTASDLMLKASMKVIEVENLFLEHFGLKVQIADFYNRVLAENTMTLGENARRIPQDNYFKEKYGMKELEYIKSQGFNDLETWNVYSYSKTIIKSSDFVFKLRGVFTLNFPLLFIRLNDAKIKNDIPISDVSKFSEKINFSSIEIANMQVEVFESHYSKLLNCDVSVCYQKTIGSKKNKVKDILPNETLQNCLAKAEEENWKSYYNWALENTIKFY